MRIFGSDEKDRVFSENVITVDIRRNGVRLRGVKAAVNADAIIGLTYGRNKVHFQAKWSGKPGTPFEGQVAGLNLSAERPLPVPESTPRRAPRRQPG